MKSPEITVVGAGIGGLASAIGLASAGVSVTVLERQQRAGGKIQGATTKGLDLDVGPTVMTMPWVFEQLFRAAGRDLQTELRISRLEQLAHHRWQDGTTLDLFDDDAVSVAACADLGGASAAGEMERFFYRAQRIYDLLEPTFMTRQQTGLGGLLLRCNPRQMIQLARMNPFRSLWEVLGESFSDVRLQQLFARYATYCGSSPFLAPSTLMLIAHVERLGVWRIQGGMRALATALVRAAKSLGVKFRYGVEVDRVILQRGRVNGVSTREHGRLTADAVVINADTNAIATGRFGNDIRTSVAPTTNQQRSLSAVTFAGKAKIEPGQLHYHNVFFSRDYGREFEALTTCSEPPSDATVYVCSPDFDKPGEQCLFVLVNAPANGDRYRYTAASVERIRDATALQLQRCGLALNLDGFEITTPNDFDSRYPGTGGALYGPAMHGWRAAFRRSGNRTMTPGLFVAGGSVHPGSGVPMAALSGQLCAREVLAALGQPHVGTTTPGRKDRANVAG